MRGSTHRLEMHVTLHDGRTLRFAQDDPETIQSLYEHLNPARLFAPRVLMLHSSDSLSILPTAGILRVDFLAPDLPPFSPPSDLVSIQEITEEEFQQRFRPQDYDALRKGEIQVGSFVIYNEIELLDGKSLFFELRVQPTAERTAVDTALFFQRFLASEGIYAERHGGGLMVINPTAIVRVTLFPGPAIPPAGAYCFSPLDV